MQNTMSGALVLTVLGAFFIGFLAVCLFVFILSTGLFGGSAWATVLVFWFFCSVWAASLIVLYRFCSRRVEAYGMACYEKGADIALDEAVRLYSE